MKGRVTRDSLMRDKNLTPAHLDLIDQLRDAGLVERRFNWAFIFGADASEARPEQAGFGLSMLGSFYMMLVVLVASVPVSVATAIYLEEFAPQNGFTDLIEINISNLAAVPSIVFGILGIVAFIQFGGGTLGIAGFKQSVPLVGGLVLSLMTSADHYYCNAGVAKGGAPVDPRCGLGPRRVKDPDGVSPCAATGDAGDYDGDHHRSGASPWRDRAAFADWYGRPGGDKRPQWCAVWLYGAKLRNACADIPMGNPRGPCVL